MCDRYPVPVPQNARMCSVHLCGMVSDLTGWAPFRVHINGRYLTCRTQTLCRLSKLSGYIGFWGGVLNPPKEADI
ncbi:MAG: hypothetical protein WBN77_15295, partial [Desulfobacterales bacterium]